MLGAGGEKLTKRRPRGRGGRTAGGPIGYDMNLFIDYVTNL
jgi:hypothetical protein